MKMVKSLLLGSAAGLIAVAGAQAADLPVKAKPVQYVKICSLYGDGFYYIPGSETCIKYSGYIRYQVGYNVDNNVVHVYGANGAQDRGRAFDGTMRNATTSYSRFRFEADARTQTAYGTLRAYGTAQIEAEVDGNVIGQFTNTVNRAFIQWAGFTIGRFASPADVPFQLGDGGLRSLHQIQTESNTGANGINGIFYTWQLGNGVNFNVGAQEESVRGIHNMSGGSPVPGSNPGGNGRVGQQTLVPFASLRVNQAWGAAAISVVAQPMRATYYTGGAGCPAGAQAGTTQCDYPDNEWGYGVRGGVMFNLPMIAPGDRAGFAVHYAVGAIRYATSNLASPGLFGSKSDGGNNVAFGWVSDGVYFNTNAAGTGGANIEKTTAWSALAGYEHYWSQQWSTTLYGSYGEISYTDTVINSGAFCRGTIPLSGQACDPGFAYWAVGSTTNWFPVPGLRFAVDVLYTKVDTALAGQVQLNTAQGRRPTGVYTAKDLGITSVIFRAQRNWGGGD